MSTNQEKKYSLLTDEHYLDLMIKADYSRASLWHDKEGAWKEVLPGVHRRILSHSMTGLMVLYHIDSGKTFAWHNHPHAQFGVFVDGEGDFRVGECVWKMKKGDSYYIPPGVFHELKTMKDCTLIDFFTPTREDYAKESLDPDE